MQIYFDLDGTLIDSRKRLYKLFQELVPGSPYSFEEYWNFKRGQVDHRNILKNFLKYTDEQIAVFENKWMNKIEQWQWLKFDKPFAGVTELLQRLSKSNDLYIVTRRQHSEPVYKQVSTFGWTDCFKNIFISDSEKNKSNIIREYTQPDRNDWMVGDTGYDIEQGKILGVKTAAVLSGFRNKENLSKYAPDYILESVLDVPFDAN